MTGGKHLSHAVLLSEGKMNDKEWLEKVEIAFKVYEQKFGPQNDAAAFVDWLFKQYGIVHKDKH